MGNFFGKKSSAQQRILMQGLDAAGKTSILYKLKLGEVVTTIPTIGFNVETVTINNFDLCCWDVGGRDKIRPLMRHYYQNTQGIVFVVDSNDTERLDDAFEEFVRYSLYEDELRDTVVMVLANKQDLAGALSCAEVERRWNKIVPSLKSEHKIMFRSCSVKTGEGLLEAFTDFSSEVQRSEQDKEQAYLTDAVNRHDLSFSLLKRSPSTFIKSLLMY